MGWKKITTEIPTYIHAEFVKTMMLKVGVCQRTVVEKGEKMSRPIDDNWHYIDGKDVYVIPFKKYRNYGTNKETVEDDELVLCEDCFEALLNLLKESVEREDAKTD